ncbi:MAG: hypothetical protein E7553_05450 [Ruminococcaceae bacterium]|nr:hypothetical protein [Oscillospiraceae bacterium]
MKWLRIATVILLMITLLPLVPATAASTPAITLDRTVYGANDTVTVTYSGTDTNDWTGLYPCGILPGSGQNSLVWEYTVGNGEKTFSTATLEAGDYMAFLCDNDGYKVLDSVMFTVRDADTADYGAASAAVQASVVNGKSTLSVTVTPSSAAQLTYRLYWAKNGMRLQDYLPIKEITHSGSDAFVIKCNDCLFMPEEADSVEVAVVQGASASCFASAPAKLKAPASTYRYSFQVLTDLHASASLPCHIPNLKMALRDVAKNSPNSIGIFTAGDNTDRGTQEQYDLLLQTVSEMRAEVTLPPITYAIGNHDEVYGGTYEEEVERFISNFGTPGLYYAVERNGTKFLILGSEEQSTPGTIGDAQLAWVEAELKKTDPNTPVFLFLHQPLKDTVSGTLSYRDSTIQRWYLGETASARLHAILSNYPNAVLFSGHTHSSFAQEQPMLYGNGVDATFINAASTAYLWGDDNADFKGSQGLYVEVYEDYILIKGRDFTHQKWCGVAQFLIPIGAVGREYELISPDVSDWTFDSTQMCVEADAFGTTFYNLNGEWPKADYVFDAPVTFSPDNTLLFVDMMLEENANANLYLFTDKGETVSLAPYIPKLSVVEGAGDLIGNGKRVRGAIPLSSVTEFRAVEGTVSATQMRVYASGAAKAKMTVYDLSLVNARSQKTVSLMNADALQVSDRTKKGGYSYENGRLTVISADDTGYAVSVALEEAYPVEILRNLLVKATATTAFDVTLTASTSKGDVTFGLAADFWPELCQAKENGFLPSGSYESALNYYNCYAYNGLLPADGMSTVKTVTVTLSGAGNVVLDALQLSSATAVQTVSDHEAKADKTPDAKGDINGDGTVNTMDVRFILRFTIDGSLTPEQQEAADVNGDGTVNTVDCRELLRGMLVA